MKKKVAMFAFNGDPMCFIHVLLNTLDMNEKGFHVALVVEGSATKLIPEISREGNPLNKLYFEVKEAGLIHCVCRACANKMEVLESVEDEDLPVCGPMAGHPSMADYINDGYDVISF
jgi:hypothetical protein